MKKKKKTSWKDILSSNVEQIKKIVSNTNYSLSELQDAIDLFEYDSMRKHDRLGNDIHDDIYDKNGCVKNSWLSIAKERGVKRLELPKNEYDLKLEKLERDEENYYSTIKYGTYLEYDNEIRERVKDITVVSDFSFIKSNFNWLRNLKIWWYKFKNRNKENIILPNKYEELLGEMFKEAMEHV